MDMNAIEKIIEIIEGSSVKEFSYKDEAVELYINTQDLQPSVGAAHPPVPVMSPMPTQNQSVPEPESAELPEEEFDYITSPIVATFYAAPAPDMPHFVNVGDHIKTGQTLCILEAMKLMNEIPAEFDCEIESILVSNEQRVEYGQPLFRVKRF